MVLGQFIRSLKALDQSLVGTNDRYIYDVPSVDNLDAILIRDAHPNYDIIYFLKKEGFDVHAGERDSFGWLSGVIELPLSGVGVVFG